MIFRRLQNDAGEFADNGGVRWTVEAARSIRVAGQVNEGWTQFENFQAALDAWGLHHAAQDVDAVEAALELAETL